MRLAIIAAVLAALAAGAAAVRSHLIGVGEARTQARWDKQKAIDQAETLRLERERSADQLIKFRNAERISDEQAKPRIYRPRSRCRHRKRAFWKLQPSFPRTGCRS
ncbi:hypothetical protein [Polaromonas sp. 17-63-33]|uniref:hypothetical protein n=1 Tax=Polaromonas sp. 17-63-33 TaxID=1970413 RepID=UPI0025ED4E33|nr:hypothetical protein [Polaromonas sp. 17-63-33]